MACGRCFAKAVEKRGIDVRFENPAVSLVQDPFTKEVSGVIARRADGTEYSIKSSKGVLLACGGYENNLTMQRDFHGMETVYTAGTRQHRRRHQDADGSRRLRSGT